MAVGRTNAAAKGGGIDYNAKPQITFDGKWSNWYIEFYAGVPYWEAVFYSSGTLSVSGSYTADAWGVGGGAYFGGNYDGWSGNGAVNTALGLTLTGQLAITIGSGGGNDTSTDKQPGGSTKLGNLLVAAGGMVNKKQAGPFYRFSDAEKSGEAGADCTLGYGSRGYGGWLHWRGGAFQGEGEGYGGGGAYRSLAVLAGGHSGALVIRIAV